MISKEENHYMPINPKTGFNSKMFSSDPVATSSSPPHRPPPKNWQQKVMAALHMVFSLICTVAAWLKGRWSFLVRGSAWQGSGGTQLTQLKRRWSFLATGSSKRKQNRD